MYPMLDEILTQCNALRKERLLPILDSLKKVRTLAKQRVVRSSLETPEITGPSTTIQFDTKPMEMESPWSYYGSMIGSAIGIPEIVQRNKEDSPYNRACVHDDVLRKLARSNNIHSEQMSEFLNHGKKITKQLNTVLVQVNEDHTKLKHLMAGLPGMTEEISRITVDIQRDADIYSEIRNGLVQGIVNTQAIAKIYPTVTEIAEIPAEETRAINVWSNKHAFTIEFLKPVPDPSIEIYKAESFRDWQDTSNYLTYIGPEYIVYNTSSNCSKFIEQPKTTEIHQSCTNVNRTIEFNDSKFWKTNHIDEHRLIGETIPKIFYADQLELIQCYPLEIIIENKTLSCGKDPFALPVEVNYTIRGYSHYFVKQEIVAQDQKNTGLKFTTNDKVDLGVKNFRRRSEKSNLQRVSEELKIYKNKIILLHLHKQIQ